MGKRLFIPAIIILILGLYPAAVTAAGQSFDNCMSCGEIQYITGIKGVQQIPRGSVKGADGDLNYARGDGQLILTIKYEPARLFGQYKADRGLYKTAVKKVGEDAFKGPAKGQETTVVFRKGKYCVTMRTFPRKLGPMPTHLAMGDLVKLAGTIAARLPG